MKAGVRPGFFLPNGTISNMKFNVKAMRQTGEVVNLAFDGASEEEVRLMATNQGLAVLAIRPVSGFSFSADFTKKEKFPLALFSRELRVLLSAGIPLVETLQTLSEREQKSAVKSVISRLVDLLKEGKTLADAMETQSAAFPPLYTSSIRASEKSGEIVSALDRYIAYQAQLDALQKKIVSASVYPLLLMGFGGLVMLFLMGYVVPKFSSIYQDHSDKISFASKMLLTTGQFIGAHGVALLSYAFVFLVGAWLWVRQPATRALLSAWIRRWPVLGESYRVFQLARLYRTLGMLLRGGMPAVVALDMASGILEPGLRQGLSRARMSVSEGQALSEAFRLNNLSTQVALRFIRVGEQSGSMSEMMENAAAFHEEELARDIDVFTRLFEPVLMMLMGLVIGAVVLLMYLPIFELASAIE